MGEECGTHGNEDIHKISSRKAAREGRPHTWMTYAYTRGQLNIKMHVQDTACRDMNCGPLGSARNIP